MANFFGSLIARFRTRTAPLTKEQEEIARIKEQRAEWQRDAIVDHKKFGHW
jgi:hypothetical protein